MVADMILLVWYYIVLVRCYYQKTSMPVRACLPFAQVPQSQ